MIPIESWELGAYRDEPCVCIHHGMHVLQFAILRVNRVLLILVVVKETTAHT